MKRRIRFGIRTTFLFGLFPNAATFVLYLTEEHVVKLVAAVEVVRQRLTEANYAGVAALLFVEEWR